MEGEISIVTCIAKVVGVDKNGDDVAGFVLEVVFLEFFTIDEICDMHVLCVDGVEQLLFRTEVEKLLGIV